MNTSKKPRFSVVIPCYNEANFIASTLESLTLQDTTASYEIIVVDNNCTDETVEIAKRFDVKIISEKQPGVCYAREAGTKVANGEIIISSDADTVFAKNWLSKIDRAFTKNERLAGVAGPCHYYNGPWWGKSYPHLLFGGVYIYSKVFGHPFYVTATNIAFKKSAWIGYNFNLMQGGDELDLLHKLRKNGKVQFVNSNPVYTSARRLKHGLFYNFFVTFLFYYIGAFYINRIFKRTIIGAAPAFREKEQSRPLALLKSRFFGSIILLLLMLFSISPARNHLFSMSHHIAQYTRTTLKKLI